MKIAINIPTFQRPDGLRRLLEGLTKLSFTHQPRPVLQIVVADNDAKASARAVAESFAVTYVVEPRQGIPFARNAALAATATDADFVCLLDDDEVPSPEWLDELMRVQKMTGADFVRGPVSAHFPEGAPDWVLRGKFFDRPDYPDGHVLVQGASNNALLGFKKVKQHGLCFNEALRFSGGSDHLFFLEAHKVGLKTVWAAKAVVTEHNPKNRATFKWLLRRQFRLGNTLAVCERMLQRNLAVRFVKASGRAVVGFAQMALVVKDGRVALARGCFSLARAAGMLAGLFGAKIEEYRPDRVNK
jgi:succinoglycan biosynthesis protein ExoM